MKSQIISLLISIFALAPADSVGAEPSTKGNSAEYVVSTFDSSGNLIEQLAPSPLKPAKEKVSSRGISSDSSSGSTLCKSKGYSGVSRYDTKAGTTVCYKLVKSQNKVEHIEQDPLINSEDEVLLPATGLMKKSE